MSTKKSSTDLTPLEERALMDMVSQAFGLSIVGELWLHMAEHHPNGFTVAQMMEAGSRLAKMRPPEYFKEVPIYDPDSLVPSDTAWTLIDTDSFSASRN